MVHYVTMEEFTQRKTKNEEDTLYDATKKLVVAPVHKEDQIEIEESSAQIAAANAIGPAIGNIASDTETTAGDTVPAVTAAEQRTAELLAAHKMAKPAPHRKLQVSLIAVAIMIAVLLFALLYR